MNIFVGNNGEGKTNILEAISYLCLTKSFYAINDAVVTQLGETGFQLSGELESDYGTHYEVFIDYKKSTAERKYFLNKTPIQKTSQIIGQFPIVVLSPEQSKITFGNPQERRRFVDFAISQTNHSYLECLIEYRRVLKQRNALLIRARDSVENIENILAPWDESLIKTGSAIIKKRAEFTEEFSSYAVDAFHRLVLADERPEIKYEPSVRNANTKYSIDIEEAFADELVKKSTDEKRIGFSLVGPHRDEFLFHINGLDLRKYASQGQHKTFLVALKLAEFNYVFEHSKETPILLLDDVLGELDSKRSKHLLQQTAQKGQSFLTSTDKEFFKNNHGLNVNVEIFEVINGDVYGANSTQTIH